MKTARLPFLAALLAAAVATPALADEYVVRMPVSTATHMPVTTTFNFGTVLTGTQPQKIFTFTNRSASPTAIGAVQATGKAKIFSHNCVGTLAPQASCQLTLGLTVDVVGVNAGSVAVSHSQATAPDLYNLSATGATTSQLFRFDQSSVNFGEVSLQKGSDIQTLTLRNLGALPQEVTEISVKSPDLGYSIVDTTCEGTLAPQGSCTVRVQFTPRSLGPLSNAVRYALEDGSLVNAVTLNGVGVQGKPKWSASSVSFAANVGTTSAVQQITLSNIGTGPMPLTELALVASSDSQYFNLKSTTCPTTMLPGTSCTVDVTFTAPDIAQRSASLQVSTTSSDPQRLSVQLIAQPVASKAVLTVSPATLDFGDVGVGVASTKKVTLASIGALDVSVSAYALAGAAPADFRVVNPNNCIGTLAPQHSCEIDVEAKPTTAGPRTAALRVTSTSADPVPDVLLAVKGLPGFLEVTPAALSFNPTQVGQTASQTLTVTNIGSASVTVNSVVPSGVNAAMFTAGNTCTGKVLAVGGTCAVTVTYAPTTAVAHTAALTFNSNAQNNAVTVSLSGTGTPAPVAQAALSDFACPAPAQVGQSVTCTSTLTNPGQVAWTYTGNGASSLGAFIPSIVSCSGTTVGTLQPGQNCTVRLVATPTAAGALTTQYSLSTSAQSLAKTVTLNVEAPSATLTMTPHGTVVVGQSNTVNHIITNNGNLPVSLTLPATLAGGSSAAFSVVSSTCSTSLAVGGTCTVTTRCAPSLASTNSGTLSVTSNSRTALTGALTCTGQAAPPSNSQWVITPTSVNLGNLKVGTAGSMAVTIKNNNAVGAAALALTDLRITGTNAAEFTVDKACVKSYTSGQSCTMTVTGVPTAVGGRVASLALVTSATDTAPQVPLSMTGVLPAFTVSPLTLDFGSVPAGSTTVTPKTAVVTNTGLVAGALTTGPVAGGSTAFAATSTCPASVAAAGTCDISVALPAANTQSLRGVQKGSYSIAPAGLPAQLIEYTVNLTEPPAAAGNLTMTCPATAYVGSLVTCSVRVNSTGTANLGVSGVPATLAYGATRTAATALWQSCTSGTASAIPAGQSCAYNISFTAATATTYSVTANATSSTVLAPVTASVTVNGPSLSLSTTNHPDTQLFSSTTATHTLTNTGLGPVTISSAYSSSVAVGVNRTACQTLASGQSCTLTTTCTPSAIGNIDATLTINGSPVVSTTGHTLCSAQAARISSSYEPNLTTEAGGFSTSGNWVRVTNAGVGPVTIQGFYPALGWSLVGNSSSSAQCVVNKTLLPGTSCLVAELLAGTQAPGATATGSQRIRTSAGDLVWNAAPIAVKGLSITPVSGFTNMQVGDDKTATFSVTNQAPVATGAITFSMYGSGFTVAGNDCPASLAPGAVCTVSVRYVAGQYAGNVSGTLSATTGYDALMNKVRQFGTARSGVQGSYAISFSLVAANVTLTAGTNTPVHVGQSVDITHVLSNNGVGAIKLTSAPSLVGNQHTLVGGTCVANATLQPGQTCTILTRFTPTTTSQSSATVSVNTNVGYRSAVFTGRVIPMTDVSVNLTGPSTSLVGGTTTYTLTVTNTVMGPAKVVLGLGATPSGGAAAYVSQFSGNICGTFTFNASGAVVSQSPATATTYGGPTCVPRLDTRQVELTMPAGRSYNATMTLANGPSAGAVNVSAALAISEVDDSNSKNDTASVATTLSYPPADLAVYATAGVSPMSYSADSKLTLTLRNLSTAGAQSAVGANGTLSVSAATSSGAATATLGALTCGTVSAGATCSANGAMYLPAGGSITVTVPYRTGAGLGEVDFTARLTETSAGVTDPVDSNNVATTRMKVADIPVEKTCMFTSPQKGKFLGSTASDGSKNGWASIGPFNAGGVPSMYSWLEWHLFDGWVQRTDKYTTYGQSFTGWYLDPRTATWKGTGKPVETTRMMDGSYQITLTTVRPVVEYLYNGKWTPYYVNYNRGQLVGGALAYSDYACGSGPGGYYQECPYNVYGKVTGAVLPIGGPYNGVWHPESDSKAWLNYRSEGADVYGQRYRQVWIERSPGPNCAAAGTTLATY